MKTLLLTLSFLTFFSAQITQADTLTDYNITEVFYEPHFSGNSNTLFTGTFTFDSTTNQITNLSGTLSEAMTGSPQALVTLSNENTASVSDGNGGVAATVYALNNTNVFSQGGNDYTQGQITYGNDNAYATIDINASNPLSGATSLTLLSYADCTAGGLMGTTCMTGHTGGGTMMATPLSETISAVPVPAALWSFMGGLIGFSALIKQRKQS